MCSYEGGAGGRGGGEWGFCEGAGFPAAPSPRHPVMGKKRLDYLASTIIIWSLMLRLLSQWIKNSLDKYVESTCVVCQ